jgi:hypothetical protein
MSERAIQAVDLKAATLFTRQTYTLTMDMLLPFRLAWTPAPDGFTVTLWVLRESGTRDPLAVHLVTIPCAFGGHRYLFRCPACGQRRAV